MIHYTDDSHLTLAYVNANGEPSTVSFNDFDLFTRVNANLQAQLQALTENQQAHDRWTEASGDYNTSVLAGRPQSTMPTKPKMKLVSDTGDVSYVDFVPPLPNLAVPAPIQQPGSGSIVTNVVKLNPVEQMQFNALAGLNSKLDTIINALRTKGVL